VPINTWYQYDVTIPAGTAINAPLVTLTQFEPNTVERIEWLFPDGCLGVVGIAIGARSVPIIPRSHSQWLIRSGQSQGMDLEGAHDSGDWSVIGYNTGQYAHTVHVSFIVHRTVKALPPPVLIVDAPILTTLGAS
jgi:hypothetical protein